MSCFKQKTVNKNIPRELFESGVTVSNHLTPAEVHALADKLLKEGFEKIRKNCIISEFSRIIFGCGKNLY